MSRRLTDSLDTGVITRLEVYSIGVYQPMFKRSYNGDYPEELEELVAEATNDFKEFTNSTMYGVASEILELDEEHIQSFIENDWAEPRLRFIIEVESKSPHGGRGAILHTVLTGYLDSANSLNEETVELALDTQFFVNNVIQYVTASDGGQAQRRYVGKAVNPISSTGNGNGIKDVMRQTNRNVIDSYQFNDIRDELGADEIYITSAMDKNTRLTASGQYIPSEYIKDSVNAVRIASNSVAKGSGLSQHNFESLTDEIIEEAKGLLEDDRELTSVGILNSLSIEDNLFIETGSFEYGKLLNIYDDLDDLLNVNIIHADELTDVEDGDVLDNSAEAEIALHLAMVLPAVCFDYLMGVVEIDIDSTAADMVLVSTAKAILPEYEDIGTIELFCEFVTFMLEKTVDNWVSNYGDIAVRATVDAMGESQIYVSVDGNNDRFYPIPQFADNTFSPLLTSNVDTMTAISNAIADISSQVYEAKYNEDSPLR